jgi:hypothetical protein
MNLNLYDILSKVIPGGIIFLTLAACKVSLYKGDSEILIGAVLFSIGYFIDGISSTGERLILNWSFGGQPGKSLLLGKSYRGIKISHLDKIDAVKQSLGLVDEEAIYRIMHSTCAQKEKRRIIEFLNSYAFSRNMFFTLLLSFALVTFFEESIIIPTIFLILTILAWLRTKKRSYYYAKEVIDVYCTEQAI